MKVVSWNIEGRLTRFTKVGRGTPEHIVEGIMKLDADIVFLAEASDNDDIEPAITKKLKSLGYGTYTVNYDDENKSRKWAAVEKPNMKLLTRQGVESFKQIRLGGVRNALMADVVEPDTGQVVRVYGIHLDDRKETYRISQVNDLVTLLSGSKLPTVVMGDFNAMHGADYRARLLRSPLIHGIASMWPHSRTKDMMRRVSDMATGGALAVLEGGSSLMDADPTRQPTSTPKLRFQEWMPSIRLLQIDHMYVSPGVAVSDFTVGGDGGSDHRAISAVIE